MNDQKERLDLNVDDGDDDIIYKSTITTNDKYKGFNKYSHELMHLLPFRSKKSMKDNEMPIDSASCLEYTYFTWITPIVWRSFRNGLQQKDVYQSSPFDSTYANHSRMAKLWDNESNLKGLHNASLAKVIQRFARTRLIFSSLFYLICLILGYLSSTLFLKNLLDFVEDESQSVTKGIKWTIGLFLCELGRATSFAVLYAISIRTAVRTSNALSGLLYAKLLTSRSSSRSIGELVNLFAVDINKVFQMVYIFPLILGGPVVTIVTVIYTSWLFGVFALVGVFVFVLIFGLQFLISKAQSYYRKQVVLKSDKRISRMTELLTYIKLIKLYAWERMLSESIVEYRQKEKALLEKCQYLQCFGTSLALLTPLIITMATILAYTLAKQPGLTAAKAFTLVMVNYVAAHGIRSLPIYVRDIVNGRISMNRIEKVLQYDDKDEYIELTLNPANSIELEKATLAWDNYQVPKSNTSIGENASVNHNIVQRSNTLTSTCLFDLNLEIPKAKHIGVIGSVGSGKSAFLLSLFNQMRLISGKVRVNGTVAYVPQQPWILNATIRHNVVFGNNFNKKRYYEAINYCALNNDLTTLSAGDQTEVGERGVTLSGGQKHRISLARAFFADNDIYLLDDPLSSVDRNVGRHIFKHCIKNGLKDKTVILVTHQIEYLENMDFIVFFKDGKIANTGVHNHLYNSDEDYRQLIESSKLSSNQEEVDAQESRKENDSEVIEDEFRFSSPNWSDVKPLSISGTNSKSSLSQVIDIDNKSETLLSGRLILDERIGTGNISYETYLSYLRAGGGIAVCSFVIAWLIFQAMASSFANWWLGYWISQGNGNLNVTIIGSNNTHDNDIIDNPNLKYYQTIYGLSIAVILCATLAMGYMLTKVTLTASSQLHDLIFNKVVKSPMSFFDSTPIGRILNIFTRDMDEMDTQVPQALDGFLQRFMVVIFNLIIIVMVFPWFLLPFSALVALFGLIYTMFRGAMRDLKRLENTMRSPIYSHITETIEGLHIIKAFGKQNQFSKKFEKLVDNHSAPNFLYYCSTRWLSTRMDILCVFISLLAAIFAICTRQSIGAAFAGLALVLSMQLSGLLQFVIRLGVDAETRFTSVERIHTYIQTLKPEKDVVITSGPDLHDWPTKGRISFRDVTMRYRPGLPLALKDISFEINPKEKIGIVGRTGAGKSSVTSVLFRLVEIDSGSVHIDGIDIYSIPLNELRSRISIIPQDPILFKGSIRKNLDPFAEFSIQQLMEVLECVHLKQKINNLKNGINNLVNENGANFSAGERQLLCMARAMLRKSKIIILDEPTSHMDGETQTLIHNTIDNAFKDCTVITIAHRLQTIIDCDRVMVMNDGKIIEFDKPSVLMSNNESMFYFLMESLLIQR